MRPALHLVTLAAGLGLVSLTARGDAPRRLEVTPWCGRTPEHVGFHLAFPAGTRRTVINLTCNLGDGECTGAQLDLDSVDRGAPLGNLALGAITGARIERKPHQEGSLHITWGKHAFLVAPDGGHVTYDAAQASCR